MTYTQILRFLGWDNLSHKSFCFLDLLVDLFWLGEKYNTFESYMLSLWLEFWIILGDDLLTKLYVLVGLRLFWSILTKVWPWVWSGMLRRGVGCCSTSLSSVIRFMHDLYWAAGSILIELSGATKGACTSLLINILTAFGSSDDSVSWISLIGVPGCLSKKP